MPLAIKAFHVVLESPTDIGSSGIKGAAPPASNKITRFGEWAFCASIAAALGAPVPTTIEAPSSNSLAAVHIISSIVL
jgi:hypothetical protein